MRKRNDSDAKRTMTVIGAVLGWMALLAVGCGNLDSGAGGGISEPADWKAEEDGGDGSSGSSSAATPCSPRPSAARSVEEAPTLPDRIRRLQCPLDRGEGGEDGDERRVDSVRWTRTEDGFRKVERGPDGDLEREVRFEVDDGSIVRVERRRTGLQYGQGRGETVWTFDGQNRLVEYRQKTWRSSDKEQLSRLRAVEQTWSEDRLVARTTRTRRAGQEEANATTVRWRYDDAGRLVEANRRTENGTTRRVEWSYDAGRPVSVKRYIDGVLAFTQSWSYRDDGQLSSRSVSYGRRGVEGELDENLPATPPLDDLAAGYPSRPQNVYGVVRLSSEKWRALPREVSSRNCYELPHSVAHGYPTERRAYRLIWESTDVPEVAASRSTYGGMKPLYGSDTFGTARPDRRWYGHGGALGARPGGAPGRRGTSRAVDVEIEYGANGRMVSETVRRTDEEGSTTVFRRSRTFGSTGLSKDVLDVDAPSGGEDGEREVHRRTLRFERGPEGRLQRRELLVDGVRVDYQEFGYDEAGRWVGLDAFGRAFSHGPGGALSNLSHAVETGELSELERTARYRRRFDRKGRLAMDRWSTDGGYAFTAHRTRITWGPDGPVEVVFDNPNRDERAPEFRRLRYDDRGRKIRLEVERDGETTRIERWKWRDDGRLAAHVREDLDSGRNEVTQYQYSCAAERTQN